MTCKDLKMNFLVLGIFLFIGGHVITVVIGEHHEQDCLPRDGFYAEYNICNRPCVEDKDCARDEGELCVCDGRCGLSCISLENTVACGLPEQPYPPNTGMTILNQTPLSSSVPFGSHASVQCWQGYHSLGDSDITCMSNGDWSDVQHCLGNTNTTRSSETCNTDLLEVVANSKSNARDDATYTVGETITYTCLPEYVTLGLKDFITCLSDGMWSPIEMECIPATCDNVGIPENGFISSFDFRVGSTVTFWCQKGHELIGDMSRTCVYNSTLSKATWTNTVPSCQALSCSTLSVTSPLRVAVPGTLYGSIATFECEEGHRLVGETMITCLSSTEWSSSIPTCERILCNVPTSSPDVLIRRATSLQILHSSLVVEMSVDIKYECRSSTKLLFGDEYRTCLEDSTFSGTEPSCHESCDMLFPLANEFTRRTIHQSLTPPSTTPATPNTAHGTVVLYYCKEKGYFLEGANRFECVDGIWTPRSSFIRLDKDNPYCDATDQDNYAYSIRTPLQYAIGKDDVYKLTVKKGSSVFIDCKRHSNGPRSWRPVWGFVSDDPSKLPDILDRRRPGVNIFPVRNDPGWYRLHLSGVNENNNGRYSCVNIGTEEHSSVMLHIGNVKCLDPGIPDNGGRDPPIMPSSAPYFFTFSCNDGYKLIGKTRSKCSKSVNYEWTTPLPVCEMITKTCAGKVFPGWNDNHAFSKTHYVTSDELDEATQMFYCDIGYTLEPPYSTIANCRNESEPQWDIEGTHISCIENDLKVQLDPAPIAGRTYSFYTGTDFRVACHLVDTDSSHQIGWKMNNEIGELVDLSSDQSSRVHTINNNTGAWLIIEDGKRFDSGEYTCIYHDINDASIGYKEMIWLDIETCCPVPTPFPNGVISAPPVLHRGYYLPGDVVTISCVNGYKIHGVVNRICLSNGTWEDFGPRICIPDLQFALYWGSRQLINQSELHLTAGSDIIIDCETEGNITDLDPSGQMIGWFRIDNDGSRKDDHFDQMLMADGYKLRLFLTQVSSEQAGIYACGTLVGYSGVHIDIMVPCPRLSDPDHGSVSGWSWRAGTTAIYTCDERYEISGGGESRTCRQSGEWTGIAPVCTIARCPYLHVPVNVRFSSRSVFHINAEVAFICKDDSEFEFGAQTSLLCQSDGTWNGTVPSCINKCQKTLCRPGAKCVIDPSNNEAKCICKDFEEDCSSDAQDPVCGSDAQTYDNLCKLEVYACKEGRYSHPIKVADRPCLRRGLCSSRPVPSTEAKKCDPNNSYYYNPTLLKCTDMPMDHCMEEDSGFLTRDSCDFHCTGVNYCNIARDPGPCTLGDRRWYWDSHSSNTASHTCVEFVYGGCEGNENNFKTRDECLMTCPDRCALCPDTMNLYNACDYGQYATRVEVLRLSRFEKTAQRRYPTKFHINIKNVLKTNQAVTTPEPQDDYSLWSTVLYRGVICPCPRFLPLDTDYLIVAKLKNGLSRKYSKEPIVSEGTFVRLWSEDLECELRCTSTCGSLFATLGLLDCPHPGNPKCSCCN